MTACKGQGSPLARLEDWYRSPLGMEVAAREGACLESMLSDCFGYYLVQLGLPESFRETLAASRIRHRILVSSASLGGLGGLGAMADPARLPLATDSVDAVLLPHTLDFASHPHRVLREVERVLIPEGRILVMGFNALSTWGLLGLLYRGARVPWCGRFRTVYRVEDWLSVLGFDVEQRRHLMFRPPIRKALGSRLRSMEDLGQRLWPSLGGVYAIRAVKRVSTLTPIRPAWSARARLLPGGAIEPSARGGLTGRTAAGPRVPPASTGLSCGGGHA